VLVEDVDSDRLGYVGSAVRVPALAHPAIAAASAAVTSTSEVGVPREDDERIRPNLQFRGESKIARIHVDLLGKQKKDHRSAYDYETGITMPPGAIHISREV
jgi:hypothetical protein